VPAHARNVAGYDVQQAEIGFIAGATAAMLSKNGAVSYVGGLIISRHPPYECRIEAPLRCVSRRGFWLSQVRNLEAACSVA
jgi:hypothetical protein